MSKLIQRLTDAGKSGIYRAPHERDIVDALRGSNLSVMRVDLGGVASKDVLMERFGVAFSLPGWFGRNWDALEEALADLAWSGAAGMVMLLEGSQALAAEERRVLSEVLATAARTWQGRGRPFFAVFVGGASDLPELYREGK